MTALKDLLADPEQPISFLVELSYRNPATDAEATLRITDKLIAQGDVPTGYLWGLLGPDEDNPDVGPGGRYVSAEAEEAGAGLQATADEIVLSNPPHEISAAGPLDFLRDLTLSGRPQRVLAGSPTEAITEWEDVGSGIAEDEPEFDLEDNTVSLRLKSALGILDQDLDVNSYVGEPSALRTIVSGTQAIASDNAAHHLTDFTVAYRVYVESFGAGAEACYPSSRTNGPTDENWHLPVLGDGSGANARKVQFRYGTGGVVGTLNLLTTTQITSGQWYTVVAARRAGHAYLMLDGIIEAESSSPSIPDQPTAGVRTNTNAGGLARVCDHRVLNHYSAPDEGRAWMAVRSPGTEQGLVGLWRGDDNGGGTLTDYSATAAHATISGVENTDYEWVSSDLGTAEMAGNSMMAVIGAVWHFMCDLVDAFRERWRLDDGLTGGPTGTITVRDQGELLDPASPSFDYTLESNNTIAELAGEAGEPLTAGTEETGTPTTPAELLSAILVDRGPLATAELEPTALQRIATWFPFACGLVTRRAPIRQLTEGVLKGLAGYLSLTREGILRPGFLLPPISPSPRGESALEFLSETATEVRWGDVGVIPSISSYTCSAWIKTRRVAPDTSVETLLNTTVQEIIIDKTGLGGNVPGLMDYGFGTSGYNARGLALWGGQSGGVVALKTLNSPVLLRAGATSDWQWVGAVNDIVANEVRFYHCTEVGGTVYLAGTVAGALVIDGGSGQDVVVGQRLNLGSLSEVSAWDKALSLTELQAIVDDAPIGTETNLVFLAPLNEGSGNPQDLVSATESVYSGCRWRPDLTVDLRVTPRPWNEKKLRPARRIDVRYRHNFARLDPGQIAVAVPQDQRQDLQTDYRTLPWPSPEIAADYLDARDVILESPWADLDGAQATMRLARWRYAEDRYFAALGRRPENPLQQGVLLEVGDEVRVYGHGDQVGGPVYLVASNRASFNDLDCELGLLR